MSTKKTKRQTHPWRKHLRGDESQAMQKMEFQIIDLKKRLNELSTARARIQNRATVRARSANGIRRRT